MIREEIIKIIQKAIGENPEEIKIERPEKAAHGDYSTNIAMLLKKNPQEIMSNVKAQMSKLLEKVEVKNGFINFFISKEYLQKQVGEILKQGKKFGQLKIGKNQKVQIEFISANPTGPLTVGNTRGGPFGDVLGNILKKANFKVEKAYYINDYGMQILILGHSVLKDQSAEYRGDYIDYLSQKIKEKDPYRAGEKAAKIIIEEMIKQTTDRLGIRYDEWFSETILHKSGAVDKTLNILDKKGLVYEKEGAKWFRSLKYKDVRDRVLVKTNCWKTYLADDIAYHRYKFEKKKFDKVINVWGADHHGDIPGLKAGIEALGYNRDKLEIILYQFVTLFEEGKKKKMSKRKGIYVSMDELLNKVYPDVIRFFFLQKSINTHLNFDLNLAQEQSEKNPVYYIQYAHARICSIIRKFGNPKLQNTNYKLLSHPSELKLIKWLIKLPEVVEDTAKDYQVQRLPQYAIDLATAFHQFYRDCKVISEDQALTQARLALVSATKIVFKNVLDLMGITSPEKM